MVYNFYNLEASFRSYLIAGNKINSALTIKNYLSDIRHFFGWYLFFLKTSPKYSHEPDKAEDDYQIFSILNTDIAAEYKNYLVENKIPLKTANRRLSTLRKFCSFCISQGWIKENPAKKVPNIGTAKESGYILNEFKGALEQDEIMPLEVQETINDIEDFLQNNQRVA